MRRNRPATQRLEDAEVPDTAAGAIGDREPPRYLRPRADREVGMANPYGAANRDYWDGKASFNVASWDIESFLADPARLTRIVAADREAVGDVRGRSLLHLQCHFGMDTLAWARLGALVTGVDFSPRAIASATDLAARTGLAARFVEADLYATPDVLRETFDIVYTGGGALCWLPDIRGWAAGGRPHAAAGRHLLHPRGASRAVVAGGRARRPSAGDRPAVLRNRRANTMGCGGDLGQGGAARGHHPLRVEPWPR